MIAAESTGLKPFAVTVTDMRDGSEFSHTAYARSAEDAVATARTTWQSLRLWLVEATAHEPNTK